MKQELKEHESQLDLYLKSEEWKMSEYYQNNSPCDENWVLGIMLSRYDIEPPMDECIWDVLFFIKKHPGKEALKKELLPKEYMDDPVVSEAVNRMIHFSE